MNSWKTTVAGVIGAVALTLQQVLSNGTLDTRTIILAVAIAALGVVAKDFNVTGGGK